MCHINQILLDLLCSSILEIALFLYAFSTIEMFLLEAI